MQHRNGKLQCGVYAGGVNLDTANAIRHDKLLLVGTELYNGIFRPVIDALLHKLFRTGGVALCQGCVGKRFTVCQCQKICSKMLLV